MSQSAPEVLPPTFPAWAGDLIESGESLAYLHLSGNHAALDDSIKVGSLHTYETTLCEAGEQRVKFQYEVLSVFNGDSDELGKGVAYRPLHDPDRIIISFRAVRVDALKFAGNELDVNSMLDRTFLQTNWLPRVARISRGICRHAGCIWSLGEEGGLAAWLARHCKEAKVVHFTGLSLAGALAQVLGLRALIDGGDTCLGERAHIFTFGTVPWCNTAAGELYNRVLAERAVHLATRLLQQTTAPASAGGLAEEVPSWWLPAAPEGSPSGDSSTYSRVYRVLDPLTAAFGDDHALLSFTYAIDSPQRIVARDEPFDFCARSFDFWSAGCVLSRLTSWDGARTPHAALGQLMTRQLAESDPLSTDYLRLHRGRAYKAALLSLVRSAVRARHAREGIIPAPYPVSLSAQQHNATAPGASQLEAACLPDADAPKGGMRRNSSSKRSLAAMLEGSDENGTDPNHSSPYGSPTLSGQRGGMTKIASYGSLADKLDEFNMC